MARVKIRLELDGGGVYTITEQSNTPLTGGPSAALLAQEAFVKMLGALGLSAAPAEQPQPTPPPDGGEKLTAIDGGKAEKRAPVDVTKPPPEAEPKPQTKPNGRN